MALASKRYLWPDPKIGPYRLEIAVTEISGRLVPVRWTVSGEPADGHPDSLPTVALNATAVHRIAWWSLTETLAAELNGRWAPLVATVAPEIAAGLSAPTRRGRRELYPDEHWEAVADIYRLASVAPVRAVAEHFVVSRSLARKWVERCRRKGLIRPPAVSTAVDRSD